MDLKRKRIMNVIAAVICILVLVGMSKLEEFIIMNILNFELTSSNLNTANFISQVTAAIVQALIMWVFYKYIVRCDVTVGKCFKCLIAGTIAIFVILKGVGFIELIVLSRVEDITKLYTPIYIVNTLVRAMIYLVVTGCIGMTPEEKAYIQSQQEEYRRTH